MSGFEFAAIFMLPYIPTLIMNWSTLFDHERNGNDMITTKTTLTTLNKKSKKVGKCLQAMNRVVNVQLLTLEDVAESQGPLSGS
jgi:hypothetical protein